MCTVTYLPLGNNDFILTSSRDESPLRKTIPPKKYLEDEVELTYPKDEIAGGTWIGFSDKKRLVCLLNGGFENHIREKNYRLSRGIIVKKILAVKNAIQFINQFNFSEIEPFTIVLVDWNINLKRIEFVWDGKTKHIKKLAQQPQIWSSSTLYTNTMKSQRKKWFANWLKQNKVYSSKEILHFHKNENLGTAEVSMKMKRDVVETVSITSIEKKKDTAIVSYIDVLKDCLV